VKELGVAPRVQAASRSSGDTVVVVVVVVVGMKDERLGAETS